MRRLYLLLCILVLMFTAKLQPAYGFSSGQGASLVIGQATFTTNAKPNPPTAASLNGLRGLLFDSAGNLWVADASNNRILEFKPPFSNGMSASVVLGQPDFTTGTANTHSGFLSSACNSAVVNACGFDISNHLMFDSSGNLWVSDRNNNRVLKFTPPFTNGMPATLVIGQPDFKSNVTNANSGFTVPSGVDCTTASANQCGLARPHGLLFDSSGNLWVADQLNSRILKIAAPLLATSNVGKIYASLVLGQPDFKSNTANTNSGFSTSICTLAKPANACGMAGPRQLMWDSSANLWVSDSDNGRLLKFDSSVVNLPGSTNGPAASLVLGQSSFTENAIRNPPTQISLNDPSVMHVDSSGTMWVTDEGNSRVLGFANPSSNGAPASFVLGQSSFTTNTAPNPPTQTSLKQVNGMAFDSSGNMWVADEGNSRVLEFVASSASASTIASTASSSAMMQSATQAVQQDTYSYISIALLVIILLGIGVYALRRKHKQKT